MKETTEVVPRGTVSPDQPTSLLQVIAQAVVDPRVDIEKMERLFALHQQAQADDRKRKFQASLAKLQAACPQISKDGRIVVKGQERSRYAKLETILETVQPLMQQFGFAISYNEVSEGMPAGMKKITATLMHEDGHSDTKEMTVPIDTSDYRTGIQSIGSTVSYARRYLLKMHLNIVERNEDDDGQGGGRFISEEQVKDLETLIQDVKADKARFLEYMGVETLAAIPLRDRTKAVNALEAKRKGNK